MGDHGSYNKDDILSLVEINVVQPRSMQQGSVALVSPKTFCRSRPGGSRRISFNRSIDLRGELNYCVFLVLLLYSLYCNPVSII